MEKRTAAMLRAGKGVYRLSSHLIVLSRSPSGERERTEYEDELAAELAAAGFDLLIAPHVYYLRESDAAYKRIVAETRPIIVLSWLYPRAARWLVGFMRLGVGSPDESAGCVAGCVCLLDSLSAAECVDAVHHIAPNDRRGGAGRIEDVSAPAAARWYPVIDYEACVACGQCREFYLFGVYELDAADQVVARHPDNCKTGCPACARVCPQGAIMFPHCEASPAIAGANAAAPVSRASGGAFSSLRDIAFSQANSGRGDGDGGDDIDSLIDELDKQDL